MYTLRHQKMLQQLHGMDYGEIAQEDMASPERYLWIADSREEVPAEGSPGGCHVRRMRLLREKYGISCRELAGFAGVSVQRISQIELSGASGTQENQRLVSAAFKALIQNRSERLRRLEADYAEYESRLLDFYYAEGAER